MKQIIKFRLPLFLFISWILFGCNQPEPKTNTEPVKTASGEFDRTILPILPHPFAGMVDTNAAQSKSDFPTEVEAPKGAPNVLVILTDDVGYGASSTFGGPIATPTFDSLAANGLRYNEFHTTALCSPTRAALITGRNHHNVASGVITEMATGFDGYNSLVPKSAVSIGEILKDNGWNTGWWGKMHNVPDWKSSTSGPFDLWPNGLGFEYFYGFIGGMHINGVRPCMKIRNRLNLMSTTPIIFWIRILQTIVLHTSVSIILFHLKDPFSPIIARARHMRLTMLPRIG